MLLEEKGTAEAGGSYLKNPQMKTKLVKVSTDKLVLWLKDKGADKNLMAIGGDSSYMNKGREVGVKHHVD